MNLDKAYDQVQKRIEERRQAVEKLRAEATEALEQGNREEWEALTYLAHLDGCKIQGLHQALSIIDICRLEEKGGPDGTL